MASGLRQAGSKVHYVPKENCPPWNSYTVVGCIGDFEVIDIPPPEASADVTTREFPELLSTLYPACEKWFNLGIQLGVSYNDLAVIRQTFPNSDDQFREMLNKRITQGELTWERIVKALEDPCVGMKDIAKKVKKKHLWIQSPPLPVTTRQSIRPDVPPTSSHLSHAPTNTITMRSTSANVISMSSSQPSVQGASTIVSTSIRTPLPSPAVTTQNLGLCSMSGSTTSTSSSNLKMLPSSAGVVIGKTAPTTSTVTRYLGSTGNRGQGGPSTNGKRPREDSTNGANKRPKMDLTYYDRQIFANKISVRKYECQHCRRVPRACYRHKDTKDKGNCRSCIHEKGLDIRQYEVDNNINKAHVVCPNEECKEQMPLKRFNDTHQWECQGRPCKYKWLGCLQKGPKREIEDHAKNVKEHFDMAMKKIRRNQTEIKNLTSTVQSNQTEINNLREQIRSLEARLQQHMLFAHADSTPSQCTPSTSQGQQNQ